MVMTKQRRRVNEKRDRKKQQRAKLMAVEKAHVQSGTVCLTELPGGPIAARGNGTIQAQATQLGDIRVQTAQRRAMAAQIGRVQGNQQKYQAKRKR
jgi:hypothetical protein